MPFGAGNPSAAATGHSKISQPSLSASPRNKEDDANEDEDKQDEDEEQCSICLQPPVHRTVIPSCVHEFCFECILAWTAHPRAPDPPHPRALRLPEALPRAPPTSCSTAAFAANPVLVARAIAFLRRELRVWNDQIDGEWLTAYVVSLMKAIDIRSEAAVWLLAEFLDVDGREVAEHFAHEVYAHLRSPYRDLGVYDTVVQYDTPENVPPPAVLDQTRRWRPAPSPSRSRSRSRSLSLSRSRSRERGGSRRDRDAGDTKGKNREKRPVHDGGVEDPWDDGHGRRRRRHSRSRNRCGKHYEDGKGKQREKDEGGGKSTRAADVEVIDVEMAPDSDVYDGDGSRGGTRKERERERHAQRREHRRSRRRSRVQEERHDSGKGKQRARSRSRTRERDARSRRDGRRRPERVRDAKVIDVDMDVDLPFHAKDHHGPGKGRRRLVKGGGRDSEGADWHGTVPLNSTEHLGEEREAVDLDPPPAPAPPAPAVADVQTAAKRIPVRPPRNLGLLGAVHAHLRAPARKPKLQDPGEVPTESAPNTNEPENVDSAALLAPPEREQPQKPVLLARISDITSIASTSTSTPAPSLKATSPPDTPVLASPDPEQQPRQTHSAREIMARTRARLARLKNQPVVGVSVPASPTPLDTPPPGAVDTRARLVDRLEEERRQVAADATVVPLAEADAGVQAEAVLRKKAQVRVRLAAAKREQESERVLLSDDDAGGAVGANGREEELKSRIMARR
ncbi:hypothetical protein FIBSPDRAFT_889247 [Athelia psychrophila]|uniref:RING-type E3 ubiquitin transferase n=1 Tax=Athelia psychrophila TaxID=1759441 RepID=A0A166MI96_9AGAM|nr:hypothetical protein FIBSPDRAFT_889247 [Fibularhizoctonia sp. CBS 109695]